MKFTYPRLLCALLGPLLVAGQPVSNVDISFDYRYDPSSFLTRANNSHWQWAARVDINGFNQK